MREARFALWAAIVAVVLGCAGTDGQATHRPTAAQSAPSDGDPSPSRVGEAAATATPVPSPGARATPEPSDVAAIRAAIQPLTGSADDYDRLIARVGDADVVLLGEPSHGTHEVYRERAEITRRLIAEEGFSGVAIEGDWPDAWRVDRYVRGMGADRSPADALGGFDTFPEWMWRNEVFAELVDWLRVHNDSLPYGRRAGVYGLDLYSLEESTAAVAMGLRPFDRAAADRVQLRYACTGVTAAPTPRREEPSCAEDVREALGEAAAVAGDVPAAQPERADRAFSAAQNARVVVNGRRYSLGEGAGGEPPWNIRDRHMAETLWAIRDHLVRTERSGRLVVWAHDSHIGDARATDVTHRGQLNLGQLVRERGGIESVLVGFSTYTGTVTAATDWGEPGREMDVRPALPGSHPDLLHAVALSSADDFLVFLGADAPEPLREERLERYIGVIYRPETERLSHYFGTRIADEYDVLIHLDETTAVQPLADEPADDQGRGQRTSALGQAPRAAFHSAAVAASYSRVKPHDHTKRSSPATR